MATKKASGRPVARKTSAKKAFKTVKFVVYCFAESKPGKEEGTMQMTDIRHKLVEGRAFGHFDSYDEVGPFIRRCMADRRL